MRRSAIEQSLIRAMEEFEIVDCHEHLGPEATLNGSVRTFREGDAAIDRCSRPQQVPGFCNSS